MKTIQRDVLFFGGGILLLAAVATVAVFCGETDWDSPMFRRILLDIRLPRAAGGALAGAALAASGALIQGVMRNALASPGIIGVSSGGGLAAIIMLTLCPAASSFLTPAAFAGAWLAAAAVYLTAWRHGAPPLRLTLAGVALSALLGSLGSAILILNPERALNALDFTLGSLASLSWSTDAAVLPYLAAGMIVAVMQSPKLDVLALGDDCATALGLRVEATRLLLLATAALLAAPAIALAGLLGFVGLVAPHIARILLGAGYRRIVCGAALVGAIMVIGCDTAGRLLAAPRELPAGVITAIIGAPFFLWLLRRSRYND
ncbi:MAG: iron ABC transporter permease [Victivallaceae bacterium]|nr:iron ABC transporter permease [Victivallaceae bacterium]